MKIRPVGAKLFHADGRTERQTDRHDEPNSHFSQFCERPLKKLDMYISMFRAGFEPIVPVPER